MQVFNGNILWSRTLTVTEEFENVHECDSSNTTDSSITMDLAMKWIRMCRAHPICRKNFSPKRKTPFTPTRLLEVGEDDSSVVRLVETKMLPAEAAGQYTTLSHCWGGKVPEKTKLPKSFQDAFHITRGIKVPFLWIDALCIIQGSMEDWDHESVLMGELYAHAVCMISATGSPDCDGGCFSQRRKLEDVSACVLRRDGYKSLVVQPDEDRQQAAMDNLFDRYVERAPLKKRGWTFQERVLAHRVLHFCDGFVLFECNTFRASGWHIDGIHHLIRRNIRNDGTLREAGEEDRFLRPKIEPQKLQAPDLQLALAEEFHVIPTAGGMIMVPNANPIRSTHNPNYKSPEEYRIEYLKSSALAGMRGGFQLLLEAQGSELGQLVEFHKGWYEMVEQYAGRNLTKESDKIPALLGVAHFIEKGSVREFVAGLWWECLSINLLWNVKTATGSVRSSFPAPTWSWVSIRGGVET
ncbi:heterokaryon incompatibility protein-domain-containing protein [Ilyonectria destructans]|nr:heterokaryon incompatibility protein-domain-containing protein [Ilyonectria destructans]